MAKLCKHHLESTFWYSKAENFGIEYSASCKEDGWACIDCKQKLGYRPDLDKEYTGLKVISIMMDLTDAGLIYISNGTERDCIMYNVIIKCQKSSRYDSQFILREIINDPNVAVQRHSDYWAKEAKHGKGKSSSKKRWRKDYAKRNI